MPAGAAFKKAVELGKANRAALTVVHVLAPVVLPLAAEGYMPSKAYERVEAAVRGEGEKQLDRLLAKARRAGARAKGLLLTGVPYSEIARVAKARRADLVVIGTHGRTGLARFFLGSVAARVIASAPCPVLTVRGR